MGSPDGVLSFVYESPSIDLLRRIYSQAVLNMKRIGDIAAHLYSKNYDVSVISDGNQIDKNRWFAGLEVHIELEDEIRNVRVLFPNVSSEGLDGPNVSSDVSLPTKCVEDIVKFVAESFKSD